MRQPQSTERRLPGARADRRELLRMLRRLAPGNVGASPSISPHLPYAMAMMGGVAQSETGMSLLLPQVGRASPAASVRAFRAGKPYPSRR
jgi:hypothetical protein